MTGRGRCMKELGRYKMEQGRYNFGRGRRNPRTERYILRDPGPRTFRGHHRD